MASTNVERAIIAMKADQDSLQARMDDMERKDEHPAGHREAMKEDHMGKDGMERGHKMAQEEYEAPDGPAPEAAMARTKENPKRVPYAQSQTGPFTSPRESDGGSPLNKRHGTAVTAAMQHMSLMAQRAYAADPALSSRTIH